MSGVILESSFRPSTSTLQSTCFLLKTIVVFSAFITSLHIACGLCPLLPRHSLHRVNRVVLSHSSVLPWLCMWLHMTFVWSESPNCSEMQNSSVLSEAIAKKIVPCCSKTSTCSLKKATWSLSRAHSNELWRFQQEVTTLPCDNGCSAWLPLQFWRKSSCE